MKTFIAIFFISFLVSFLSSKLLIYLNIKKFYDVPDRMRKIHQTPVLRGGGISIFVGVLTAFLSLLFYHNKLTLGFVLHLDTFRIILIPASLVFILGLFDDAYGLSARVKLPIQFIAATILFFEGIRIEVIKLPFIGVVDFGYFSFLITLLWIVGITNGFNFIDGMDGLASGISFFAALTILLISLIEGNYVISIFSISICGSVAGFFKYNWHPAQIFLGDSGSYFLGFLIGALSIISSTKSSAIVTIVIPLLVLAYPLLDISLAILRRIIGRKSLFAADREHIHHKLLKKGYPYKSVVFFLYLISGLFGMLAIFTISLKSKLFTLLIPIFSGIFAIYFVKKLEYEEFKNFVSFIKESSKEEKKRKEYIKKVREKIKISEEPSSFLKIISDFFEEHFKEKYFLYIEGIEGKKLFLGNKNLKEEVEKTGKLFFKFPIQSKGFRKAYLMFTVEVDEVIYEDFLNEIYPVFIDKVKFFGGRLLK